MGVVALVTVGGCTGGEPRPVETTATVTPSPSPTSTPMPTPMAFPSPPAVMSEPTPEGAIAAGTQFVALYDYAFSTGDVAPLMAMSAEGCEYCAYVRDRVQEMVDGGYSSIREPARVIWSDSAETREDEWFRVHLRVEQGPLVTVTSDGAQHQTSDGATVDLVFAMSWIEGWRVDAVDLVEVTS